MKVSLNKGTYVDNSFCRSSISKKTKNYLVTTTPKEIEQNKIRASKVKKVVSQSACLLFGATMVYFATKRTFKHNRLEKIEKIKSDLRLMDKPPVSDKINNKESVVNFLSDIFYRI